MSAKYKVWIECGDVILETDDLAEAAALAAKYAESDGAYITDANDKCL
jgi:hypothetical protein